MVVFVAETNILATCALAACLMTSPMVLQNLIWPICHERGVIFFFAIALFAAAHYHKSRNLCALFVCTVSIVTMTFFKETAFLLSGSVGSILIV
jgi:hypothetical protein